MELDPFSKTLSKERFYLNAVRKSCLMHTEQLGVDLAIHLNAVVALKVPIGIQMISWPKCSVAPLFHEL